MRKGLCIVTVCLLMGFLPLSPLFIDNNARSFQSDLNIGNPDLIWSYTFGTNDSHDAAYSVIRCLDGGYFITGSTRIEGTLDVIMIRLNETGELEWTNTVIREGEQTAQEVIECVSGGYAIIGYSQEQSVNGTIPDYDAYIIRVHTNGSIAWTQTIGTNTSQQAYSIIEYSGGGFAFAGYSAKSIGGDLDFWLVRTTSEGQPIWNRTYGSNGNDICYSLVETNNRQFIMVGRRHTDTGDQDGWIIETSFDGSVLWNRTYGGPRNDVCHDIIRISTQFFVVVGTTEKILSGGLDGFLLGVQRDGDIRWNTTLGGFYNEEAYSITSCHDGGYAITGYTIEQTTMGTKQLLWVARIDPYGNVEWNKRYGGAGREIGWSIIQARNHDFIIAGTTEPNRGDNIGTDIWIISVPDISPFNIPGQPDFVLIFLGIATGVIIIAIAASIYTRSKRNLRYIETEASKRIFQKNYILPRPIEELTPIISGIVRCRKCGTLTERKEMRCSHCSALLHRCLFCDNTLTTGDVVIFCPSCKNISHANEMLSWLKKRGYCPRCRFKLKKS
ncbi:MAG: hypothetical protein ACFFAL_08400 [Promethearchaeota archaeon]